MSKQTKIHARHEDVPKEHHVHRTGDWLPGDHRVHKEWLNGVIEHVDKNPKDIQPIIQEFKTLIETNTRVYMLVQSMFEQIPSKKPYSSDPTGHKQIRDHKHMLQLLNHLMTTAPHWSDSSHRVGMVGVPINAVLDWPMGTPSGFAFFLDPDVNQMLEKVLDAWGAFLCSEDSAKQALHDGPSGWFSAHGKSDLSAVANGAAGTSHAFEDLFECDPSKPYHGFASWDAFFTRKYREHARPIAAPDDDNVIANACESKAYNVAHNVALRDAFWIKGQLYSVLDMLAHDERAPLFVGGTVYQAFLSALSYHRWHAPVNGRVVRAYVKEGTYYSEPLFSGVGDPERRGSAKDGDEIDKGGETDSQVYLTAVATRAIIFIEADNPAIGLMAFLGVGMAEVSTCEITVREGDHVKKGDEIGMFHFGGSTHCLMFRKGVDVQGFPEPGSKENVPVRGQIAVVA
ncbi:Phophatidylserine decarboxylase-domain-containing protein [Fomitopsis serialis]|uniref:Phophatidylserine decarboxylase-domain-containing protein n=1 Tax=Fomitopsis serialis TaxID=139415 RepID=UPI0020089EB8|nr:Phophatidylserine decarboxylase-domain-containing protein [Neoantrodia serialis]KAH9932949.1 Phophatidylserine decarboxylase-domain-containing protein [Neoantrodia serialis]